jgi:hypothetical protein
MVSLGVSLLVELAMAVPLSDSGEVVELKLTFPDVEEL